MVPWPDDPPPGIDAEDYALIRRILDACGHLHLGNPRLGTKSAYGFCPGTMAIVWGRVALDAARILHRAGLLWWEPAEHHYRRRRAAEPPSIDNP